MSEDPQMTDMGVVAAAHGPGGRVHMRAPNGSLIHLEQLPNLHLVGAARNDDDQIAAPMLALVNDLVGPVVNGVYFNFGTPKGAREIATALLALADEHEAMLGGPAND